MTATRLTGRVVEVAPVGLRWAWMYWRDGELAAMRRGLSQEDAVHRARVVGRMVKARVLVRDQPVHGAQA